MATGCVGKAHGKGTGSARARGWGLRRNEGTFCAGNRPRGDARVQEEDAVWLNGGDVEEHGLRWALHRVREERRLDHHEAVGRVLLQQHLPHPPLCQTGNHLSTHTAAVGGAGRPGRACACALGCPAVRAAAMHRRCRKADDGGWEARLAQPIRRRRRVVAGVVACCTVDKHAGVLAQSVPTSRWKADSSGDVLNVCRNCDRRKWNMNCG